MVLGQTLCNIFINELVMKGGSVEMKLADDAKFGSIVIVEEG